MPLALSTLKPRLRLRCGRIERFNAQTGDWEAFQTTRGTMGAKKQGHRPRYGKAAQKVLQQQGPKPEKQPAQAGATVAQPRPASGADKVKAAEAVAKEFTRKIADGSASYLDLVEHVVSLSRTLTPPELTRLARNLGSTQPIKSKDDALRAVQEQLRSHRTERSKIYTEQSRVRKFACTTASCGACPRCKIRAFAAGLPGDAPDAAPVSSTLGSRQEPVDFFAVGNHRGDDYTPEMLRQVAANYQTLSQGPQALFRVPVVIGHDEADLQIKNTGQPASGLVEECWFAEEAGKLQGTCVNMLPKVMEAIQQGAYFQTSAEFYEDFVHEGNSYGLTLRRVALLGGDLPEVKTLNHLPGSPQAEAQAKFAEAPGQKTFWMPGLPLGVRQFASGGQWQVVPSKGKTTKIVRPGSKPKYGKAAERILAAQQKQSAPVSKEQADIEARQALVGAAEAVRQHGKDSPHAKAAKADLLVKMRAAALAHDAAPRPQPRPAKPRTLSTDPHLPGRVNKALEREESRRQANQQTVDELKLSQMFPAYGRVTQEDLEVARKAATDLERAPQRISKLQKLRQRLQQARREKQPPLLERLGHAQRAEAKGKDAIEFERDAVTATQEDLELRRQDPGLANRYGVDHPNVLEYRLRQTKRRLKEAKAFRARAARVQVGLLQREVDRLPMLPIMSEHGPRVRRFASKPRPQPFKTRRGTTGAVLASGRRVYGQEAEEALQRAGGRDLYGREPTGKNTSGIERSKAKVGDKIKGLQAQLGFIDDTLKRYQAHVDAAPNATEAKLRQAAFAGLHPKLEGERQMVAKKLSQTQAAQAKLSSPVTRAQGGLVGHARDLEQQIAGTRADRAKKPLQRKLDQVRRAQAKVAQHGQATRAARVQADNEAYRQALATRFDFSERALRIRRFVSVDDYVPFTTERGTTAVMNRNNKEDKVYGKAAQKIIQAQNETDPKKKRRLQHDINHQGVAKLRKRRAELGRAHIVSEMEYGPAEKGNLQAADLGRKLERTTQKLIEMEGELAQLQPRARAKVRQIMTAPPATPEEATTRKVGLILTRALSGVGDGISWVAQNIPILTKEPLREMRRDDRRRKLKGGKDRTWKEFGQIVVKGMASGAFHTIPLLSDMAAEVSRQRKAKGLKPLTTGEAWLAAGVGAAKGIGKIAGDFFTDYSQHLYEGTKERFGTTVAVLASIAYVGINKATDWFTSGLSLIPVISKFRKTIVSNVLKWGIGLTADVLSLIPGVAGARKKSDETVDRGLAKAKDLAGKAGAKAKDLAGKAGAKAKDLAGKAVAKAKDLAGKAGRKLKEMRERMRRSRLDDLPEALGDMPARFAEEQPLDLETLVAAVMHMHEQMRAAGLVDKPMSVGLAMRGIYQALKPVLGHPRMFAEVVVRFADDWQEFQTKRGTRGAYSPSTNQKVYGKKAQQLLAAQQKQGQPAAKPTAQPESKPAAAPAKRATRAKQPAVSKDESEAQALEALATAKRGEFTQRLQKRQAIEEELAAYGGDARDWGLGLKQSRWGNVARQKIQDLLRERARIQQDMDAIADEEGNALAWAKHARDPFKNPKGPKARPNVRHKDAGGTRTPVV